MGINYLNNMPLIKLAPKNPLDEDKYIYTESLNNMPLTIKNLINGVDKIGIINTRDFTTSEKDKEAMVLLLNTLLIPYKETVKNFIKDNLTLMLESITESLPTAINEEEFMYKEAVINIINLHK